MLDTKGTYIHTHCLSVHVVFLIFQLLILSNTLLFYCGRTSHTSLNRRGGKNNYFNHFSFLNNMQILSSCVFFYFKKGLFYFVATVKITFKWQLPKYYKWIEFIIAQNREIFSQTKFSIFYYLKYGPEIFLLSCVTADLPLQSEFRLRLSSNTNLNCKDAPNWPLPIMSKLFIR